MKSPAGGWVEEKVEFQKGDICADGTLVKTKEKTP